MASRLVRFRCQGWQDEGDGDWVLGWWNGMASAYLHGRSIGTERDASSRWVQNYMGSRLTSPGRLMCAQI